MQPVLREDQVRIIFICRLQLVCFFCSSDHLHRVKTIEGNDRFHPDDARVDSHTLIRRAAPRSTALAPVPQATPANRTYPLRIRSRISPPVDPFGIVAAPFIMIRQIIDIIIACARYRLKKEFPRFTRHNAFDDIKYPRTSGRILHDYPLVSRIVIPPPPGNDDMCDRARPIIPHHSTMIPQGIRVPAAGTICIGKLSPPYNRKSE